MHSDLADQPTEDLGFGRVVAQQARGRFLLKDGTPNTRKYGLGGQLGQRLCLKAFAASWPAFFTWLFGLGVLVNGMFALAYAGLGQEALAGAEALGLSDPFLAAFCFSVGVFTTVGTGSMHAVGSTANWVVTLESLAAVVAWLGAGGLVLARLTRPRARVRFSHSAVIAPYEDGRGFMFRIVNMDLGELSDVEARVSLAWFEEVEGQRLRQFHQLDLELSRVEFFSLHWTVVHPITATSPLRGVTPERLRRSEAEFLVLVTGHEETFSTRVTARSSYTWDEVGWDGKFADMFVPSPDGTVTIDVERLDRIDRLAEGVTATPARGE